MRDLHSHYLAVDDGAHSLEEGKMMLELAHQHGVTDIMFTPHYMEDTKYISSYANNKVKFQELVAYAQDRGINIYLGNEVYFSLNILDLLKSGEVTTLNNSRYMLIEIPLYDKENNIKSVFFDLMNAGITPILAHPERYQAYHNDLDFFFSLRKMGVLMQINLPSVIGEYGPNVKKMAKKLLKANLISFVGSDIHSTRNNRYKENEKAIKKVRKLVGSEKASEIIEKNFIKVVNNEEI